MEKTNNEPQVPALKITPLPGFYEMLDASVPRVPTKTAERCVYLKNVTRNPDRVQKLVALHAGAVNKLNQRYGVVGFLVPCSEINLYQESTGIISTTKKAVFTFVTLKHWVDYQEVNAFLASELPGYANMCLPDVELPEEEE